MEKYSALNTTIKTWFGLLIFLPAQRSSDKALQTNYILWVNGDSFKGYAKVVNATNGNGIEIGEDENGKNYVVWYNSLDSLPEDAVLVT